MIPSNELLARIEARQLWSHFHKDFLIEVRTLLREQLPRDYRVFVESQAVIIAPPLGERVASVEPDLAVGRSKSPSPQPGARGGETAASLEVEEDCEVFTSYSLVIRRAPENRLIAACEMLSPTNKGLAGKPEEKKYLRKRDLYIESGVNLLEIDALVEGKRLLPSSLSGLSRYARNAWTLLHTSAKRRWRGWGWDPHEPLPTVDWEVEEGVLTKVGLGQALERAAQFNLWDELAS